MEERRESSLFCFHHGGFPMKMSGLFGLSYGVLKSAVCGIRAEAGWRRPYRSRVGDRLRQ